MKLHKRIKYLREEKGLKLIELHQRMKASFGEQAVTYRTLQRIQAGHTKASGFSLYQICMGLGVTLRDVKESSEEETSSVQCTRQNNSQGLYIYGPEAYAEILTSSKIDFVALKLMLKPGTKTKTESDPQGQTKFTKWVYVQKGEITCLVDGNKYILKKGDSLAFDSRLKHCFQNHSSKTANCLLIQNPRNI